MLVDKVNRVKSKKYPFFAGIDRHFDCNCVTFNKFWCFKRKLEIEFDDRPVDVEVVTETKLFVFEAFVLEIKKSTDKVQSFTACLALRNFKKIGRCQITKYLDSLTTDVSVLIKEKPLTFRRHPFS